jgi:hypothetical protein
MILLDENFPLRFYTRIQKEGSSAPEFTIEISSFGLDRKNCYF